MSTSYSTKQKRNNNNTEFSEMMPQNIDAEEAILGAILVSPVCMNKVVEHEDTPSLRGMIRKVEHLVEVVD